MAKTSKGKSLFGIIGGVFGGGKGPNDEEIKEAEAAVRRDPNSLRKQHKLADLYAKAEQIGKAVDTYLKLAEEYIAREFFPQAIAVYKQVLKLNPNLYDVRLRLAEVYNDTGRRSDALSTLQELALRYESTGAVRIAGEVIAKMIEIDPDNIPLRIKLAELYLRISERQSSIYEFEKALRKIGEKEHWSDYIKVGERLLFVEPEHLHTLKMVSRLYLDANDPMKAIVKLQQAFKLDRRDADTLELLALAFEKLEQPAKTISVLEELGDVYVENDRLEHALEVYQQLLDYDPSNEHYRSTLERLNNDLASITPSEPNQAGLTNMNPAAHIDSVASAPAAPAEPELSEADVRKMLSDAEVYLKYGMQDRVLEVIEQVLAAYPDHPKALELRVDVYLALQQTDAAAKDLLTLAQQADGAYEAQPYLDRLFELENISSALEEEAYQLSIQLKHRSSPSHGSIPVIAVPGQPEPGQAATYEADFSAPSMELEIEAPSMMQMDAPAHAQEEAQEEAPPSAPIITTPPVAESRPALATIPPPSRPALATISPPSRPAMATPSSASSPAIANVPPIATIPTATPPAPTTTPSTEMVVESVDEIEVLDMDDGDIIVLDDDVESDEAYVLDDEIIVLDEEEVTVEPEPELEPPASALPPPTPLAAPDSQPPGPKPLATLTPPSGTLRAATAGVSTASANPSPTPLPVTSRWAKAPMVTTPRTENSSLETSPPSAASPLAPPSPSPSVMAPPITLPAPPRSFASPPPATVSETQDDPFARALQRVNPNATLEEEEDDQAYAFLAQPIVVEKPDESEDAQMSDMEAAAARLQALIKAKEETSPPQTSATTTSSPSNATLPPPPFARPAPFSELPPPPFATPSQELHITDEEPTQERSISSMLLDAVQEEPTVERPSFDSTLNAQPGTSFSQEEIQVTDSLVLDALNDESPFSEEFEQAFRYTQQEEYEYALEIYNAILAQEPGNDVARRGKQEVQAALKAQKKHKQEGEDLLLGLDLDSVLGSISEKERDRAAQQIQEFASAIKKEFGAEEGETHFDLGLAYQGMGLYAQAIDAFETCINGGYRLLDAHKMIGHCYGSQGLLQDAISAYKRALHIPGISTEERLDTLYEIGLTCEQSQRYALALQYFEEVAQLDNSYRKVLDKIERLNSLL